jgi:hypothetical protein
MVFFGFNPASAMLCFQPICADPLCIRAIQEYAQRHFTLTERHQMTLLSGQRNKSKQRSLDLKNVALSWDINGISMGVLNGCSQWDMNKTGFIMIYPLIWDINDY